LIRSLVDDRLCGLTLVRSVNTPDPGLLSISFSWPSPVQPFRLLSRVLFLFRDRSTLVRLKDIHSTQNRMGFLAFSPTKRGLSFLSSLCISAYMLSSFLKPSPCFPSSGCLQIARVHRDTSLSNFFSSRSRNFLSSLPGALRSQLTVCTLFPSRSSDVNNGPTQRDKGGISSPHIHLRRPSRRQNVFVYSAHPEVSSSLQTSYDFSIKQPRQFFFPNCHPRSSFASIVCFVPGSIYFLEYWSPVKPPKKKPPPPPTPTNHPPPPPPTPPPTPPHTPQKPPPPNTPHKNQPHPPPPPPTPPPNPPPPPQTPPPQPPPPPPPEPFPAGNLFFFLVLDWRGCPQPTIFVNRYFFPNPSSRSQGVQETGDAP